MANLLVIADDNTLIGRLPAGPQVDILLSCGDLHDRALERVIGHYNPRHVLAVKGNHDFDRPFGPGITSLHAHVVEIGGIRFGGFAGSWKGSQDGHHLFTQEEAIRLLADFPRVDVFLSHNSPAGVHERDQGDHQGFAALKQYIARHSPRLLVHGHQHVNATTVIGTTTVLGVYGECRLAYPPA